MSPMKQYATNGEYPGVAPDGGPGFVFPDRHLSVSAGGVGCAGRNVAVGSPSVLRQGRRPRREEILLPATLFAFTRDFTVAARIPTISRGRPPWLGRPVAGDKVDLSTISASI